MERFFYMLLLLIFIVIISIISMVDIIQKEKEQIVIIAYRKNTDDGPILKEKMQIKKNKYDSLCSISLSRYILVNKK